VVLDVTPFYAESGGQVGDTGTLETDGAVPLQVKDTQKHGGGHLPHRRMVQASCWSAIGSGRVDRELRRATALHHSATHLLHAALRQVLGRARAAARLPGGAGAPALRLLPLRAGEPAQLRDHRRLVNAEIRENHTVETRIMDLEDAKASGAMACSARSTASRCGCCAWATSPPSSAAAPMSMR
jgi:alanyl-tRNA synthetase